MITRTEAFSSKARRQPPPARIVNSQSCNDASLLRHVSISPYESLYELHLSGHLCTKPKPHITHPGTDSSPARNKYPPASAAPQLLSSRARHHSPSHKTQRSKTQFSSAHDQLTPSPPYARPHHSRPPVPANVSISSTPVNRSPPPQLPPSVFPSQLIVGISQQLITRPPPAHHLPPIHYQRVLLETHHKDSTP